MDIWQRVLGFSTLGTSLFAFFSENHEAIAAMTAVGMLMAFIAFGLWDRIWGPKSKARQPDSRND